MYMSSDLMINCPYLQFEIMDSHYIHFCRIKCFVYGKLRPLCLFCIRFTSEEPSVVFARKQPSDDKQWFDLQHRRGVSPHLLLYLQNHHPHASTSTNSVCFTRSMKFADINCPEQSRHIRSRTSPLLQQSSHHVKWLLPLAHQKMTKEAVTVYCCVRNRQNTWLSTFYCRFPIWCRMFKRDISGTIRAANVEFHHTVHIGVVYNCAKFHIPVSCLHVANVLKYFIKL